MEQNLTAENEFLVEIEKLTYHPFLDKIYVNRDNYDLESLINSITENGLLNAITISERFEVLDGEMRVEAYKRMGLTQIRCRVKNISENDIPEFVFAANLYRVKSEQEIMKEAYFVYAGLQRHQGVKQTGEILTPKEQAIKATNAKFSPRTFQKYIDVIKADEKFPDSGLLKGFESGKISITRTLEKAKEVEERTKLKAEVKNQKIIQFNPVETDRYKTYHKSNWDMSEIPDDSIDTGFCSHPYLHQRTYGNDPNNTNEIGREKTAKEHIDNLAKSYGEQLKKLKATGNVFVNMADTYKCMEHNLIPEKFVLMMADLGYHKLKTCIWIKTSTNLIGNIKRRPATSYEPFYWFVKDKNYEYNPIPIPHNREIKLSIHGGGRKNQDGTTTNPKMLVTKAYDSFTDVINQTEFLDVITTNSAAAESKLLSKYYGGHQAMFPLALPLLPILQTCPKGGSVLDMFMGSGSTLVAGLLMGRKVYGYETEAKYFEIATARLKDVAAEINLLKAHEIEDKFNYKFNQAA